MGASQAKRELPETNPSFHSVEAGGNSQFSHLALPKRSVLEGKQPEWKKKSLFGSEVMVLLVLAGVICLPVAFLLKEQILGLYAFQANIQWWYFLLPTVVIVLISMSVVFYQIIKAGQVDPVKLLKDD